MPQTIEKFREDFGASWYAIINSPLGRALLEAMRSASPTSALSSQSPQCKTENAALFLGNVEGWESAVLTIESRLFQTPDASDPLGEATYGVESEESRLERNPKPKPKNKK